MEFSDCCKTHAIESFRENPYDHHDSIETYSCENCGKECDLYEAYPEVKIEKMSGLKETAQYFIYEMQPKLIEKYFDINSPIGF